MRIAVVSDIHSNLPALEAVLASIGTIDVIWHLGDVVGYGPDPDEVVARLRDLGAVGVQGNHDAAALGGEQIEWFNPDARRAMEWTRGHIAPATQAWLATLPERRTEGPFGSVHGSYRDPTWEYISHPSVARTSLDLLGAAGVRHGLFGHTHIPVVYRDEGGRVGSVHPGDGSTLRLDDRPALLNPGSVGQPRDGIPEASYLILDTERDAVTWRRVAYDIAAVQARMRAVALPERLILRLDYGM